VPARRVLLILCLAELLAMTMWFTGTTALPQLAVLWRISIADAAPLTTYVQYGFVTGALLIALTNLAEVSGLSLAAVRCPHQIHGLLTQAHERGQGDTARVRLSLPKPQPDIGSRSSQYSVSP